MVDPLYEAGGQGVAPRRRDRLLHLLLPAPCCGCGEPLPARRAPLGLCGACRSRLRPLPTAHPGACTVCGRRLAAPAPPGFRCGRCRAHPPAFDRLLAAWSYEPPLEGVVRGLKFGRLEYLGRHLAAGMAELLGPRLAGFDALVPVPLHWRRRLARGYNQAERIARPLSELVGVPLVEALSRRRATRPQTTLPRGDRLANLRRAFHPRRSAARLAGRRLVLVDDVATTGATLDAAAAALRRAGALEITAVVAGRTPLLDEIQPGLAQSLDARYLDPL